MERIASEGRLDEWCIDNLKYLIDTFGRENIVSIVLHMDEKTYMLLLSRLSRESANARRKRNR